MTTKTWKFNYNLEWYWYHWSGFHIIIMHIITHALDIQTNDRNNNNVTSFLETAIQQLYSVRAHTCSSVFVCVCVFRQMCLIYRLTSFADALTRGVDFDSITRSSHIEFFPFYFICISHVRPFGVPLMINCTHPNTLIYLY